MTIKQIRDQMEYVKKKRKQARQNYNRQVRRIKEGFNVEVMPGFWNQVEHDYKVEFAGLCIQLKEGLKDAST